MDNGRSYGSVKLTAYESVPYEVDCPRRELAERRHLTTSMAAFARSLPRRERGGESMADRHRAPLIDQLKCRVYAGHRARWAMGVCSCGAPRPQCQWARAHESRKSKRAPAVRRGVAVAVSKYKAVRKLRAAR